MSESRQSSYFRKSYLPLMILCISLLFTLVSSFIVYTDSREELLSRIERTQRRLEDTVQSRMQMYINTIVHTRSFIISQNEVTRAEYAHFINNLSLETTYPGILGIAYVLKLEPSQIKSHEAKVHREGFPNYKVWPNHPRENYTAIYAIEPFNETNKRAFGFDMFTEPVRREAMEKARDTGRPATTKKLVLVQEKNPQTPGLKPYGYIIFVPIYKKGLPIETVEQRRLAHFGYVTSVFRATQLFDQILKEENYKRELITFKVFDGPVVDENELVYLPKNFPSDDEIKETFPVHVRVANQSWTLQVAFLPGFTGGATNSSHWIVLALGTAVSILLYLLFLSSFEQARAQESVTLETEKLNRALQVSEQLAKNRADRQAFLAEAGQIISSTLDIDRILKDLAVTLVPRFTDVCLIHKVNSEKNIELIALVHKDNEQGEKMLRFTQGEVVKPDAPYGPVKVIRTGSPEYLENMSEDDFAKRTAYPEHLSLLQSFKLKSYLCVPLRSQKSVVGCITLFSVDEGRRFNHVDLEFLQDLAGRVSVAIDNAQLYSEAKTLNRIKDEFLATLSHELRTPLNVILGHADILKSEAPSLGEDLDFSVDAIYRNAKLQTQLVSDLLDISAIITGKISFDPVLIKPSEVAVNSIESIRFAAESKGVQLVYEKQDSECTVLGDAVRLQQIIWNLLSNAVKFTPSGGRVTVRTYQENGKCTIEVSDTGKGIEADFLPYVFDRFRQEDNSLTRKFGGLGLGLSIVRQLAELHGGSIHAESPGQNKGSTFRVQIPVTNKKSEPQMSFFEKHTHAKPSLSNLKLLIVDDEKDARELMEKIVKNAGATCQLAATAAEGYESYKSFSPDIVISDIGMPLEDGYSLIKRIRSYEAETGLFTPAVALTAYARDEDRNKALSAGFQVHLAKPVTTSALIEAITKATE